MRPAALLPDGRFCTQAYTVCACGPLRGCGGFCLVLHPLSVKVRECVESEYGLSPFRLVLAWGTIQEEWPGQCHLRMSAWGWKWIVVSLTSCCFPSQCLQLSWSLAAWLSAVCYSPASCYQSQRPQGRCMSLCLVLWGGILREELRST